MAQNLWWKRTGCQSRLPAPWRSTGRGRRPGRAVAALVGGAALVARGPIRCPEGGRRVGGGGPPHAAAGRGDASGAVAGAASIPRVRSCRSAIPEEPPRCGPRARSGKGAKPGRGRRRRRGSAQWTPFPGPADRTAPMNEDRPRPARPTSTAPASCADAWGLHRHERSPLPCGRFRAALRGGTSPRPRQESAARCATAPAPTPRQGRRRGQDPRGLKQD